MNVYFAVLLVLLHRNPPAKLDRSSDVHATTPRQTFESTTYVKLCFFIASLYSERFSNLLEGRGH